MRKPLRCNPDVCTCRTLQRPGDAHGNDVVDDLAGDALFGCTDAGGAFAHAVAHVVVMSCMLHADVTISLPTIIHIMSKSRTCISTSMQSVASTAISTSITINIHRHRLKTHSTAWSMHVGDNARN